MRFHDEKVKAAWLTFLVGAGLMVAWYVLKSLGDVFAWLGAAYQLILSIFMPFIIAVLVAYLLEPVVDGLQKLILFFRKDRSKPAGKISRIVALIVFMGLILGLLALGGVYFFPALGRNVADIATNLPQWITQIRTWIDDMKDGFPLLADVDVDAVIRAFAYRAQETMGDLGEITVRLFTWGRSFGNGLISLGMGFIFMAFLLYDKKRIVGEVARLSGALMKPERYARAAGRIRQISHILNAYLRGRVVESTILSALCLIGCSVVGSRFSVLIAVMVGILNLIPYVGSMFSFVIALLIALLDQSSTLIPVGIVILLAQILDNAILVPLVIGDSVGLSPIWVLLATALFGKILGVIGMLLAPPILAILFLFIDDTVRRKSGGPPMNIVRPSVLFRRKKREREDA